MSVSKAHQWQWLLCGKRCLTAGLSLCEEPVQGQFCPPAGLTHFCQNTQLYLSIIVLKAMVLTFNIHI